MISLAHAPNATKEQQVLCRQLLRPWRVLEWRSGAATEQLEAWFKQTYSASDAVGFATGREALYAGLQALGIGRGDEVIIQAFTCIVVPHALIWNGVKPVYVDIDATLNLDPHLLEQAITPATKAILVQHTFGMPADMDAIMAICKKHGLLLIEDVAHAFGSTYQGKPVGQFGDLAIFSFGRDKAISSTSGGMAIVQSKAAGQQLRKLAQQAPYPSLLSIKQNLLHPLIIPWCLQRMGKRKVGSLVLRIAQHLRLVNRVYTASERDSIPPRILMRRLPNAMAMLAWQQLRVHHETFIRHRQALAKNYAEDCAKLGIPHQQAPAQGSSNWLRFTVHVRNPNFVRAQLRQQGYLLGDWYTSVIMPKPHDALALGYQPGSCPKAEQATQTSLNLPTHIAMPKDQASTLLQTIARLL